MSEQISVSEQIKEQLSAWLDGELPAAEQRLLLERMGREPALRARLSRYQLIRDAVHQALPSHIDLGLADRVRAALDEQPAHRRSAGGWAARAVKPLAGLAVAASVAVVAVLAVQQLRTPDAGAMIQVAAIPPTPTAVVPVDAGTRLARAPQGRSNERLNEYLVNHSEYAASGGLPGIPPYVRIVGYEQE